MHTHNHNTTHTHTHMNHVEDVIDEKYEYTHSYMDNSENYRFNEWKNPYNTYNSNNNDNDYMNIRAYNYHNDTDNYRFRKTDSRPTYNTYTSCNI